MHKSIVVKTQSCLIRPPTAFNSLGAFLFLAVLMYCFLSVKTFASVDIVTVNVGESQYDQRVHYKNELVKLALEITKDHYGPYEIVENKQRMNISRAFRELEKGDNLSLTFAHTRPEFENKARAIRVSLRGNIDSYRLLVVRKEDEQKFANIQTLAQLKEFRVGLSANWATYKKMQAQDFKIVDASIYATMFSMLERGRFDFVPRALNEVYDELALYQAQDKGLAIVPNIALYIPANTYMFVSPKQDRIFQRLNSGIHALNVNGGLSKLSDKYYEAFVAQAKIQDRRILTIQNKVCEQ